MRKIFVITILILSAKIIFGSNTLFDQANKYYAEEKYEDAISVYDSIYQSGFKSEALFYNLANSHYKLQNWAQSILYYEKTLKINIKHEDAKYNLQLAQLNIVDKIESIPKLFFEKWINTLIIFFSFDIWGIFCVILLWLSFFAVLIQKLNKLQLSKYFLPILITFSILTFTFANRQFKQKHKQKQAIIFSSTVPVKSAPSFSANDLFSLHAGSKINITDQIGDWIHIQLANGNKGWIVKQNCKEI